MLCPGWEGCRVLDWSARGTQESPGADEEEAGALRGPWSDPPSPSIATFALFSQLINGPVATQVYALLYICMYLSFLAAPVAYGSFRARDPF